MYWKSICLIPLVLISSCAITPSKTQLTLDKTIELDERAVEDLRVGFRFEWLR